MRERDLLSGLIRLHILHHASQEAVFGLGIMEELARHGYKLSAGTLYPILHGLEKAGYLASHTEYAGRRKRRAYVVTDKGITALRHAKAKVRELFWELIEEELQFRGAAEGVQGERVQPKMRDPLTSSSKRSRRSG